MTKPIPEFSDKAKAFLRALASQPMPAYRIPATIRRKLTLAGLGEAGGVVVGFAAYRITSKGREFLK